VLASASERRRKILEDLGLRFRVVIPETEEVVREGDARGTAVENALRKNAWCRDRCSDATVVSADTVIDFEGTVVTKPATVEEARGMFRDFSGRAQSVLTAVAFSEPRGEPVVEVVESRVVFKVLSEETISEYFAGVDPLDKAGGYDIDQRGELIIASFSGSRTNIMGLPRETIEARLNRGAGD
jgi:septum formation protein